MKIRKKTKHFRKKAKPIPVETYDLPNNVRIGYKDVKIRYVRPNYKKWEMTDCFGEYDYRQNVIQIQHDLCGQEMANTIFHEIMHAAVHQLTNVMMGVFRDNPWMIDMVKTQLEDSEDAD